MYFKQICLIDYLEIVFLIRGNVIMKKKYFLVISMLLVFCVVLSSCNIFKAKKNNVPEVREESSSKLEEQSSSSSEPSTSSESSTNDQEYVDEIENWKNDILDSVNSIDSVNDIKNASPELKEEFSDHISKAKEYLDYNQDGKLQFAFFASKKGIASTIAITAIDNIVKNYSYVDFLGDAYSVEDIINNYGENVELILVGNKSDENLMNDYLKSNGFQTGERYVMVMDASQLASML